MSETDTTSELDEAIAAAELDDDEAAHVRELVEGGGIAAAAIEHVLGEREAPDTDTAETLPPAPPAAPAFVVDDRKVEKEIGRHLEAMATLLGPTAELYQPCEECGGIGLREGGPAMLGNEKYQECATCAGFGQVLTGSRDPSWRTQPCPGCAGRGFLERIEQPPGNGAELVEGAGPPAGYGTPPWMGDPNLGTAAGAGA